MRCVPEFSMEEIMKKILSIALIVALAVTSVFAATYNGEADIELGFDLDSKDYGFTNTQLRKLKWTLTYETGDAGSEGEGDLKAVIAATFSASQKIADDSDLVKEDDSTLPKEDIAFSAAITKADILYKDVLRVGILNAGKSAAYAKSTFKIGGKQRDNVGAIEKYAPGFNFTVYGFNGGFGLWGNTAAETFKYFGWVETKSFDLAEGLTAQAAFAIAGNETDKAQLVANAKADYKNEDAKVTASLATDFGYKNETAALDLALKGTYDFLTVEAYVGSANKFEDVELAAKLSATYTFDGGSVGGSFQADDIADKDPNVDREFTATLNGNYTLNEMVKFEAEASFAIIAKKLTVKPAVSYINEKFTAKAGLELGVLFGESSKVTAIKPYVTVSSDKLISNATVAAGWKSADLVKNAADEITAKGVIYTSCSISF